MNRKKKEIFIFYFLLIHKECEQELNRLKNLLDENCRMLQNDQMNTGEVTRSLADELTEVRDPFFINIMMILIYFQIAKYVTKARIQLENRIEQQRGFLVELDSLIQWLTNFRNESKTIDNQVSSVFVLYLN